MKSTPVLVATALAAPARALLSVSRDAVAKPEYAKKEGKECAYCHVKAGRGGPRNEKGLEYAKNGHSSPRRASARTAPSRRRPTARR
jgi:hypothetical protein